MSKDRESFVMLTLEDYESQKKEMVDMQARIDQVTNQLMKFESFLKMMDNNEGVIKEFNKNLEDTGKIGTALFRSFESVKEALTIDLKGK